jgi:hypothetical protein
LIKNHLAECQEAQKVISAIDAKKDSKLVYDDEKLLKKKGYSKLGVNKIKS